MHADNTANTRLTFGRYLGYGLGDLAFNFYWLPLNFFLMKYYTDVLGLPSATAGLITAIGLIWDAAIDPAIGVFANKTRSRFGRYRPYMLFGSIPLAASFTLIFYPMPLEGAALVAYAFAVQLLFRTAYAAVNIPYGAMMASMTRDSMERNWLAGARMFCAFSGSAIVGYYTPRLVGYFEAGQGEYAYFIATGILSSIAVVVTLISFAFTKEKIHDADEIHSAVLQMLKMLARNPPFLQAMGGIALFSFSNVVVSATLAYFVQYYMGQDKEVTGNVVGMIPLAQMCSIIPWTIASQYLGKRWAWITGLSVAMSALAVLFFVDQPSMSLIYVLFAVYAVGCGSLAVNFWSIVPDTVEYGEWRTGVRAEGFIFGFVTLIQKIALGLSSGFVGLYLGWIGYVANQDQTPETLQGLKTLITVVAIVGMAASCVVIYFYKLNAASHAQLVSEIAMRQKASPA
jgi:GPH family glycoside/pentoside/hexuronide:cation symporter